MSDFEYEGSELDIFMHAINWKSYWSKIISNYVNGDILEVGSGIGGNLSYLFNENVKSYTGLEPDISLSEQSKNNIPKNLTGMSIDYFEGVIDRLDSSLTYDTILYIDVLEHIKDDKAELILASSYLKKGGHLIVLSPAHQHLFSEFDKAIGHYRRYDNNSIALVTNDNLKIVNSIYLDSVGYFASLANKLFLKERYPSLRQIQFWDSFIIRLSTIFDKLFFFKAGKTIVAVFEKI